MLRITLSILACLFITVGTYAQTPGTADFHRPSSFDNSYAGTLPSYGAARSQGDGRYGFAALFELRVAPGVVKSFDVRQYFPTEQLAVQGFMRVQNAMPNGSILVAVNWIAPTNGDSAIGN